MSFLGPAKRLHSVDEANSAYLGVIVSKDRAQTVAPNARNVQVHSIVVKVGVWSLAIVSAMRNASWDVCVMMTYFAPIYAQMNYPAWGHSAVDQLVNVRSRAPV